MINFPLDIDTLSMLTKFLRLEEILGQLSVVNKDLRALIYDNTKKPNEFAKSLWTNLFKQEFVYEIDKFTDFTSIWEKSSEMERFIKAFDLYKQIRVEVKEMMRESSKYYSSEWEE